jgi:hypothetical protein
MLANGLTFLTALLPLLSVADAAHSAPRHHRRHHGLAARDEPHPRGIAQVAPRANAGHSEAKRTIKRAVKKRGAQQQCRVRGSAPPTAASSAAASAVSSVAADSAVPSPAAPSSAAAAETPSIPNQNAWADQVSLLHSLPKGPLLTIVRPIVCCCCSFRRCPIPISLVSSRSRPRPISIIRWWSCWWHHFHL